MAVIDISQFEKLDAEYGDCMYKLWGPTLLGYPQDVNSNRLIMFSSNQKQFLTLLNPDVPHIQTGFENVFGKHNKSYTFLEGSWEVKDKIPKFRDGSIYTIVLYNKKTDTYEMIEKAVAEYRTEKFGFVYDTSRMDELQPGDIVKDEVITKSTSYDEHMNYRLGKNANVMYSTSNPTIEDAVVVRKGWADNVRFVELDSVMVPANDNDIFLNLYGDDEHYKPFPRIGEHVSNSVLCALRRVVKDHILYDFQSKNLREAYPTDLEFFVSKDAMVYDINVYYNGEEPFPENVFYKELAEYYHDIQKYADRVANWASDIKKSGSKYTDNIPYLRSKYMHVTDPEYKWKYKDREFSNILIEFKVVAVVTLQEGFKVVGRYGDKGVISKLASNSVSTAEQEGEINHIESMANCIMDNFAEELDPEELAKMAKNFQIVEDSEMPYFEDGTKVDILLNSSGAIRRLNWGQITELDLNFQMESIRRKMLTLDNLDDKVELLFRFLKIVNEDEYKFFYQMYSSWDQTVTIEGQTIRLLNQKAKEDFIRDVEENGIYLVKPPHYNIRYDTVKKVYHEFPFIQPVQLYIDMFGIPRKKVMRKCIVGSKYMYVLKQTSNKNFSARSTGRVNKKGLPEKSTDKRDNRAEISHNPLKIGEAYNLFASISGEDLAEFNIFMRNSPIGRKSLKRILAATGNPLQINKLKLKDSYRNTNADILNAYLKPMGIRLNFVTDYEKIGDVIQDVVQAYQVHGYTVLDLPTRQPTYAKIFAVYDRIMNSYIFIDNGDHTLNETVWNMVFADEELKDLEIDDTMKNVCKAATSGEINEMIKKFNMDNQEDSDENPVNSEE